MSRKRQAPKQVNADLEVELLQFFNLAAPAELSDEQAATIAANDNPTKFRKLLGISRDSRTTLVAQEVLHESKRRFFWHGNQHFVTTRQPVHKGEYSVKIGPTRFPLAALVYSVLVGEPELFDMADTDVVANTCGHPNCFAPAHLTVDIGVVPSRKASCFGNTGGTDDCPHQPRCLIEQRRTEVAIKVPNNTTNANGPDPEQHADLAADLAAKEAELATNTADLAAKEADLTTKEAQLAAKEADLANKEAQLAAKQADLAEREAVLAAKEATMVDELDEREKVLNEREENLIEREGKVAHSKRSIHKFRKHQGKKWSQEESASSQGSSTASQPVSHRFI